jgi:hypothetical protein
MFGKLIRLLTLNYLTLGWWFPPLMPAWKKARRGLRKKKHWEHMIIISLPRPVKEKDEIRFVYREFLRHLDNIAWYSPKERNKAIKIFKKTRKVYLPVFLPDVQNLIHISRRFLVLDSNRWECCGGEWRNDYCGCLKNELRDLKFPFQPLASSDARGDE